MHRLGQLSWGLGLVVVTCLVAGCDGSHADAAAAPEQAGTLAVTPACSSIPGLLVDASALSPGDSGFSYVNPAGLVLSGTDLFYALDVESDTGSLTGSLFRVSTTSAGRPSLIASGPSLSIAAVTPSTVFFLGPEQGSGNLFTIPPKGGTPRKFFPTSDGGTYETFLAADTQNVYFTDNEGTKAMPLAGGKAAVITGVTSYSAVTIGKNLYLADSSGDILSVAIDTIYGDAGGGPAAAVTTLTSGLMGAYNLIACGQQLCYTLEAQGYYQPNGGEALMAMSLDGTTATSLVPTANAATLSGIESLAYDGNYFYWTVGTSPATLYKMGGQGSTPIPYVTMMTSNAGTVAFDDECLYWSSSKGIYSVAKSAAGPFVE